MTILIGFLTAVLILNCLLLALLVLIQLPKKEAGAGLAFGGGATDALFGAGSGTALTKMTKYATGTFFALSIILSVMSMRQSHGKETDFRRSLSEGEKAQPTMSAAPTSAATNAGAKAPAADATTAPAATAPGKLAILSSTNAPAAATTNK